MAAVRSCLRRLPRLLCARQASNIHVMQNAQLPYPRVHVSGILGVRAFSSSARRLSEGQTEKTYNFNVQDEEDFQERVLNSETPTVVDFHADWCGPCKLLGPKLEKAIDEHEGKVLLAKVDIDELSDIAMKYNVRVVPTVVGFKNGDDVSKFEGNLPDGDVASFVNNLLSG